MKKIFPIIFITTTILLGLGLLLYSDISSWYNGRIQVGHIQTYNEDVARMNEASIEMHFHQAQIYNDTLNSNRIKDPFFTYSDAILPPERYYDILNVGGIMAYLEIPKINVHLPIFHGTSRETLDRGLGHMEGTSFPIGGIGTHAVLTGHSGLVNARMFTDLEKIVKGDLFFITVLDHRLAYEVDQLLVVLPHEVESLRIAQNADHVTLITCTPYAINTHRLLVRGSRIAHTQDMNDNIVSIKPTINWQIIIILSLILILLLISIIYNKMQKTGRR